MTPTIGVTPCHSLPDYLESIRRAGGEPRVLDPAKDEPASIIAALDGLLLTGGTDIDPGRYGEEPRGLLSNVDKGRDEFEFDVVLAARDARLPVLGICRGLQVVNVALGGSLVQDIATELPGSVEHSVPTPQHAIAHEVWVIKGSLLASLMQEQLGRRRFVRRQQPAPPGGQAPRPGVRGDGHGARRHRRGDRVREGVVLPRRAVAPRELLADR